MNTFAIPSDCSRATIWSLHLHLTGYEGGDKFGRRASKEDTWLVIELIPYLSTAYRLVR